MAIPAAIAAAGCLFGKCSYKAFSYNRKNFMFDQKLRQGREFQEQNMRIEQFELYRQDVRDLVELTVGKMDLYLVSGALLIDKTIMMLCKQNVAFGEKTPEWLASLNSLSLASAVFFLLFTVWLAMYASVSAQSFGTRLLTQFVRLPIASDEQIQESTSQAEQYEAADIKQFMRLPILQRKGVGTRAQPTTASTAVAATQIDGTSATAGAASDGLGPDTPDETTSLGRGTSYARATYIDPARLIPTKMLKHIATYRRVQLNWQAFDAYARVSLFMGANSLLYCCLYWALSPVMEAEKASYIPAVSVALLFSMLQLVLTRLDLRLQRWELVFVGIILALIPLITSVGMMVHRQTSWVHRPVIEELCGLVAHALHLLVAGLAFRASQPNRKRDKGALLPHKFRSALYLDVFGWLVNPKNPATLTSNDIYEDSSEGEEEDNTEPPESPDRRQEDVTMDITEPPPGMPPGPPEPRGMPPGPSPTPARSSSSSTAPAASSSILRSAVRSPQRNPLRSPQRSPPHSPRRSPRPSINFEPGLQEELRNTFSPPASPREARRGRVASRRVAYAGQGSRHLTTRSMTQEDRWGGSEAAPDAAVQSVPERRARPGVIPWRAYLHGSVLIGVTWLVGTCASFIAVLSALVDPILPPKNVTDIAPVVSQWLAATVPRSEQELLRKAACSAAGPLSTAAAAWHWLPRLVFAFDEVAAALGPAAAGPREALTEAQALLPFTHSAVRSQGYLVAAGACRLRRLPLDVSFACSSPGHCMAALLQPGGRAVLLCRVKAWRRRWRPSLPEASARTPLLPLRGRATLLRLAPGAPALRRLVLDWHDTAAPVLNGLRIFGRAAAGAETSNSRSAGGALLAFRPTTTAAGRWHLAPEYELERANRVGDAARDEEQLLLAGGFVLSLEIAVSSPTEGPAETCDTSARVGSAPAISRHRFEGARLQAWSLETGGHSELQLPGQGPRLRPLHRLIGHVCGGRVGHGQAAQ